MSEDVANGKEISSESESKMFRSAAKEIAGEEKRQVGKHGVGLYILPYESGPGNQEVARESEEVAASETEEANNEKRQIERSRPLHILPYRNWPFHGVVATESEENFANEVDMAHNEKRGVPLAILNHYINDAIHHKIIEWEHDKDDSSKDESKSDEPKAEVDPDPVKMPPKEYKTTVSMCKDWDAKDGNPPGRGKWVWVEEDPFHHKRSDRDDKDENGDVDNTDEALDLA